MTGWRIDPTGVKDVLTKVNKHAKALGKSLTSLGPALEGGVTAAQSPAIAEAIQAYFEQEEGPRIQGMNARISAAASGAVAATQAYIASDLEMAANAQSSAVAAISPPQPPRRVR
ncbi:DUF6507 family protein [Microbacterium sp. BWT-B31]|uniref:DUF6507 family protein n=1 Tax=Microbacterium sp. BWT-B31 TaxID=3232072 RepID=UPI003528ACB9